MRLPGRGQDRGATQSGTPREYFEEIHRGCQLRRLRQGPVLRALHFALAPPEQAPLEPEHPACSRRCCGHPQAPECVHLVPQGRQGDPPGISASRVRRAFSPAEGARFVVPACFWLQPRSHRRPQAHPTVGPRPTPPSAPTQTHRRASTTNRPFHRAHTLTQPGPTRKSGAPATPRWGGGGEGTPIARPRSGPNQARTGSRRRSVLPGTHQPRAR